MKKKMTLKKAAVAAGVVAMSVGLFNSFIPDAHGGSGGGPSVCSDALGPCANGNDQVCDAKSIWHPYAGYFPCSQPASKYCCGGGN